MEVQLGQDVRVTLELTQSLKENTSTVRAAGLAVRNRTGVTVDACWLVGEIRVDGALAANLILNNTQSCDILYAGSWSGGGEASWSGYSCQSVTVPHESDGTAAATVTATLRIYRTSGQLVDSFTRSAEAALPRIPRATTLSAQPCALGQTMTVQLTRAAAGFLDTVSWQCGSESGALAETTAAESLSWTPPLSLAAQQTQGNAVSVMFTCITFSGEEQVGAATLTVELPIPAEVVPQIQLTVSDDMDYPVKHGGYIQNQSRCLVQTRAAGQYGAEIREISVRCGSLTGTGAEVRFALEHSGAVEIAVTATDSRGRTASARTSITVLPYERPSAQITAAFRCTADGTAKPDGEYLCLQFSARATPVAGSTASYAAVCRVHGGQEQRVLALDGYANQFQAAGTVILPAGADSGYDCTIAVTDSFATVQSSAAFVGVAFVLLDFSREAKAVGIGMRAQGGNTLSLGLDTDLTEHRLTNLAAPTAPTDAATKAYVDELFARLAENGEG